MATLPTGRTRRNDAVQDAYLNLVAELRAKERRRKHVNSSLKELGEVVYYVWRAPHIKIGYSSNLRLRLANLNVPLRNILALQPGTMADEAAMHERFHFDRVHGQGLGREHFWPSERLLAHINDLRAKAGLPRLAVALMPDE